MMSRIFLAAARKELAQAEHISGEWQVTTPLSGIRINCLVSDPHQKGRVYAGTQEHGVLVSLDLGKTWQPTGMAGVSVISLAANPNKPGLIYAGCKPVSLYVTKNGGKSWDELEALRRARRWWWFSPAEPPGWTPYVMALTISPKDPDVMLAG